MLFWYWAAFYIIYYSQLINGHWTKPVSALFANNIFEFKPVASLNDNKF